MFCRLLLPYVTAILSTGHWYLWRRDHLANATLWWMLEQLNYHYIKINIYSERKLYSYKNVRVSFAYGIFHTDLTRHFLHWQESQGGDPQEEVGGMEVTQVGTAAQVPRVVAVGTAVWRAQVAATARVDHSKLGTTSSVPYAQSGWRTPTSCSVPPSYTTSSVSPAPEIRSRGRELAQRLVLALSVTSQVSYISYIYVPVVVNKVFVSFICTGTVNGIAIEQIHTELTEIVFM